MIKFLKYQLKATETFIMAIPNESILSVAKDSQALLFLRVLTPQLVKKITKSTGNQGKVLLVDMLFNKTKIEEHEEPVKMELTTSEQVSEASMLSVNTNPEANKPIEEILPNIEIDPNNKLEKAGIFSKSKLEEMELERLRREEASRPSATVFLLEERRKLKMAQEKIKKKEVLDMYSSTAKTNVKESKNKNLTVADDGEVFVESSSYKGGLINKRQY